MSRAALVHRERLDGRRFAGDTLRPVGAVGAGAVGGFLARNSTWVREAGYALAVLLPVYALSIGHLSPPRLAIVVPTLYGAIWFFALRRAFAAVHFALGIPVRAAAGTLMGLAAVSALNFWAPNVSLPAPTLLGAAVSIFVLSTVWELAAQRLIGERRVLVVGTGPCAAAVIEAVELESDAPFRVVGLVRGESENGAAPASGAPLLGDAGDLSEIVEAEQPDLIVLADGDRSETAVNRLLDVRSEGFKVVGVTHFFEHAFGRVPLPHVTATWFVSMLHLRHRPYTRSAKRVFDIVVASVWLALTAPLFVLITLLVRLTPGPAIYRQTRVGEGGKHFTMYKFRTMRADAEAGGEPVFAAEHDPRVTAVGRLLRKTHLDELPQLWDVLKGDMSIVGPRPERPEFVPMLEQAVPFFTRRLMVKPGITGWAQVRGDYAWDCDTAADKLSYDLWYLRHRTLMLDFAICAKTFSSLFVRPGR
jgi:exopolysaccharide biosynthesis polyprenyl glycosylphosphotransferase